MLFYSHLLLGIVFYLLFGSYFEGGNNLVFFLFIIFGSIFPDVDEKTSKINHWFGIFGKFFAFLFRHRGIVHTIPFFIVCSFIVNVIFGSYYAIGLFIGFLAHLTGDIITPMGIKPFHPFLKFRLRGPIKVGGLLEHIIVVLLVIIILNRII